MGIWSDLTGAKGFHLYDQKSKETPGLSINFGTGFMNDLLGPKSDYMLEIWVAGVLDRAIIIPVHPEMISIQRPTGTVLSHTFGYLPMREHTLHRHLIIEMKGRSGVAQRQGHDREGGTTFRSSPELIRELDAFLDYYNEAGVKNGSYFADPLNYRKTSHAVCLVFRSFSENIHVRCEVSDWKMSRNVRTTRFGYEWQMKLQAYSPATAKKAPALFGFIGDVMKFVEEFLNMGANFAAMANNIVEGVLGIARSAKGAIQSVQNMSNQLDKMSQNGVALLNVPKEYVRGLTLAVRTAKKAVARIHDEKSVMYEVGTLSEDYDEEVQKLKNLFEEVEKAEIDATTAAGAMGARVDRSDEQLADVSQGMASAPNPDPAGPNSPPEEQYSMPGNSGDPVLEEQDNNSIPVHIGEGDNLLTLARQWLGDSRYWLAIAIENDMPTPYYNRFGQPLQAGDVIQIPQSNTLLQEAQLSPTQDFKNDRFGTDLYLNPRTGDLDIVADEDVAVVRDKENLEQAIRNRLFTQQGECTYFPEYGLPVAIGSKHTEKTVAYIGAMLNAQLTTDPRIIELDKLRIIDEGDGLLCHIELVPIVGSNIPVISPI